MAINKRERNLLVITVSLVLLGLNYLLIVPLIHGWQKMGNDLSQKHREFEGVTNTIARVPEWQAAYEKLGHNLKQGERFEAVSDVLKKLDEIAIVSGVAMQSKRSSKQEE